MPTLTELEAAQLAKNAYGSAGSVNPDAPIPPGFVEDTDLAVTSGNGGGYRVFLNASTGEAVIAFKGAQGPVEVLGGAVIGVWGSQYMSVRDEALAAVDTLKGLNYQVIPLGESGGGGSAQSLGIDKGLDVFYFNSLPLSPEFLAQRSVETGLTVEQIVADYQANHTAVGVQNSADIATALYTDTPVAVNGVDIVLPFLDASPREIVTPDTFWWEVFENHDTTTLFPYLNEINDLPVLNHFQLDDTLTRTEGVTVRFHLQDGSEGVGTFNEDGTAAVHYTNTDGSGGGEFYDAAGEVSYSYALPTGPVDNSLLTVTTNTDPGAISQEGAEDLTATANDITLGFLRSDATGLVSMPASMINEESTGVASSVAASDIVGEIRVGNRNLSQDLFTFFTPTDSTLLSGPGLDLTAAGLNLTTDLSAFVAYTDPLVLDLNGDGVKLTDYATQPVLFDIDHDGGSLEITGWVSAADGIVVHDLDGDGVINDMSETLSEYYNGTVGTSGNPGTKPFTDGFVALKSLDSNSDNVFNSTDALFTTLRVWVDANSDGKTDAGELKTFTELGITQINLTSTTQSGLVRDGNEVLASGTFVQSGQTKEALAANFLANPNGHTFTRGRHPCNLRRLKINMFALKQAA